MRYLVLPCLVAVFGLSGNAVAADPPKLLKELALVPKDGLAMISLNLSTAGEHPAFRGLRATMAKAAVNDELAKESGLRFEDVARVTAVVLPPYQKEVLHRFEPEVVILLTTHKPLDRAKIIKSLGLYGNVEVRKLEAKRKPGEERPIPSGKADAEYYFEPLEKVVAFADERTIVFWPHEGRTDKLSSLPNPLTLLRSDAETGPLAEGVALAAAHPLALAANPAGLKHASQNDPPPDDFLPLLRADKFLGHATLGKDTAEFTFKAVFAGKQWAADGEEAAKKARAFATMMLKEDLAREVKRAGSGTTESRLQHLLIAVLEKAVISQADNAVTLTGRVDLGPNTQALLTALPGATTEAALQTKSLNNLKQIGLAYHCYADANNGSGPANIYSADGKPLLSWRVHLLPYVEQDQLYRQFKLDEPWDSETNKKLIEKIPPAYTLPGVKTKDVGVTFYQAFVGKKDLPSGRPVFLDGEKRGLRFPAMVTDGTANSLLCVEAQNPVVWTKPDDLPFEPDGPLPKLGQHFLKDQFHAVLLDGSARRMSTKLPEATLKAYITINGGEVIPEDDK